MPKWEVVLDFVGLSRVRINAFVLVVGLAAVVVLSLYYRGTGAIVATAAIAVGVVLAGASLALRSRVAPSWVLCLVGLVVAVAGAVVSVKVLGIHNKHA
ncbi:MAG TPA: hypothetical protein VEO01_40210 [Pseudonocardiaceae bacterium]|nr:hypothetical protein [Pseudonocardiaceae bacterium]